TASFDAPVVDPPSVDVVGDADAGHDADDDPTSELPLPPPSATLPGPGLRVPPAPPALAGGGPSRQPVTPEHALPVPKFDPTPEPAPSLPTRTRGNPSGPAAEVDRLDDERPVAASSAPSALRDALSAFDRGRKSGADALPVRSRTATATAYDDPSEEPASIASSRLDPDALRERLRAFQ